MGSSISGKIGLVEKNLKESNSVIKDPENITYQERLNELEFSSLKENRTEVEHSNSLQAYYRFLQKRKNNLFSIAMMSKKKVKVL